MEFPLLADTAERTTPDFRSMATSGRGRMAPLWHKPLEMDDYFLQLMIDHRGSQKGFPRRVDAEIAALQEYYSTIVYP